MLQLSGRQASIYALLVFSLTIALSVFMPSNPIALSGLLVVIFLTVFIQAAGATYVAGGISVAVVTAFLVWNFTHFQLVNVGTELLFILILIVFSVLIVLYIKTLIRNIQFDKSHMGSLFENATEGILLTNSNADIVLANPAACAMFHYQPDELIGQKIEVLLPGKYRTGHQQLRNGFYQHPQNRQMGSGRDLHGQRKGGSTFPVEVSLSSYKQKETQYVIAFVVDITHRKEIEESMLRQQQQLEAVTADMRRLNTSLEAKVEERTLILKEALQRLEQSQTELHDALDKERQLNEIKSRFVSMASHEFRTPLSAVLSSASLVSKYTTTEQQEARTRHINRIKDSVKHLNNLLEDFLSLGKLDEGKIEASFTQFSLPDLVQDTIESLHGLVQDGQEINYRHDGDEIINSDKNLLRNILINLVSNAVKFSEQSAPVKVKSVCVKGAVELHIQDAGIGIAEEDQTHLFTSFFRGRNAANIPGTGLGLHIVKRYVDLLGGTIQLQSKLHIGTTITVYFQSKGSV
ncbi:MAG TPA: PAS domain-containing sensor histidine kinase [Chitinophagaceae bacterium]|nr:PAS domain-containing sensor histidine kinase [Chitinophagaceae bacterium]